MTEKSKVLAALRKGDFEVEIEGPDCFIGCTRYDGTEFYLVRGDDATYGMSCGFCTVYVGDYTFQCDLDTGEWSGDELVEDEDVVAALESADGVICGSHESTYDYWEVYVTANDVKEGCSFYCIDEDECPKDVDSLDSFYENIEVRYASGEDGEWESADVELKCSDIYSIYSMIGKERLSGGKEVELSMKEIRDISEEIHSAIMDDLSYEDENADRYVVIVSEDYFDSVL